MKDIAKAAVTIKCQKYTEESSFWLNVSFRFSTKPCPRNDPIISLDPTF